MKMFTYAFNNPAYLSYQCKCLRKFIQEPFDFFCIDNSNQEMYTSQFKTICQNYNINYVRNLKPDHSLPGTSHYTAMQWSYNTLISHTEEIIVMMDHDTFAVKPVSIMELLGNAHVAGAKQSRKHVEYLHPSLMIFDTKNMPNKYSLSFKGSTIDEQLTDIGGELYFYFRDNPVKVHNFGNGHISSDNPFISDLVIKYGYNSPFEMVADKFFHPRNGSNWEHVDKISFNNRENFIFELLERGLNNI